jgi:hypothetical protein
MHDFSTPQPDPLRQLFDRAFLRALVPELQTREAPQPTPAPERKRKTRTRAVKLSRREREARKAARAIYDAIAAGAETRREIREKTGLTFERIGDGIAALLIEPSEPLIRLHRDGETARFFTVRRWPEVST